MIVTALCLALAAWPDTHPTQPTPPDDLPAERTGGDCGCIATLSCPMDLVTVADAGTCTADLCWEDPDPACKISSITCMAQHDSGPITLNGHCGNFPSGSTVVTCSDACSDQVCSWTITVEPFNRVIADVQLSPPVVATPFERCIAFELFADDCASQIGIEQPVAFGLRSAPGSATTTFDVPCATYGCATARDTLHTLRAVAEPLEILPALIDPAPYTSLRTVYRVAALGNPAGGGRWLWTGNLNDDCVVDILDFGVFMEQFGTLYRDVDTSCETPAPHADFNGDGVVDESDYAAIAMHFLTVQKLNCCDAIGAGCHRAGGGGLRTVAERVDGKGRRVAVPVRAGLTRGDLNGDGWIDTLDMDLFETGVRPRPARAETGVRSRSKP